MLNSSLLIGLILLFLIAAYFDIKTRTIPNRVVFSMFIFALIYFLINFNSYNWSLLHTFSLIVANLFWVVSFYLSKGGFGGADAKIFMAISFLFYPITYWYFVMVSFVLGIVLGIAIKLFYKNEVTIPLVVPIAISFIYFTLETLI